MKVVILAGGLGTRLTEETQFKPKPMVEIGGRPILWHIMKHYAHHGFTDFVVALGYKAEVAKRYFLDYHLINNDIQVQLANGQVKVLGQQREDWQVSLMDTGLMTQTGGRVRALRELLAGEPFMLTYGDGVCDVALPELLACHRRGGRLATLTAVRPPARFGGLALADEQVMDFTEKPQTGEGWINGGFMVLEPRVLDYIAGPQTSLEKDVLEVLASEGQLTAYRHSGYWQCMDTLRDLRLLESLWASGQPPWKVWGN